MDLPQSNSFYSILVVVDCFTQMVHFIPCNKSITSEMTTKLFLHHVFHYHGFPKVIIFYCEATLQAIKCEDEVIIDLPSLDR